MQKTASAFATVTFAVGLGASAVFAQSTGPVQAPSATLPSPSAQLAFPGTFGVPSAVAPRSGSAFVGATYATPRGGVSGAGGDGDLVAGYSIGNPLDAVSLTIGLALTGTNPLGDAGAFSLTASRLLQAGGNTATFFGVSASNLLPWGVNARRSEQYSGYVSHLVGVKAGSVEIPLQFVLGYGTDNTRDSAGAGLLSDGVFAGFGIGVSENTSVSVSATRTQVNVGMSYALPRTGLSATFGVMDATDNTDRQQVSFSVGYGF